MLRKASKGSNSAAVHECATMGSRNGRLGSAHRALGYLFVLIVSAVIASCATNDPRRRANISEKQDQNCVDAYANFDSATWTEINSPKTSDATRITLLKSQERGSQQMRDPQYAKCWDVAYEHHPSDDLTKHKPFELFYAEFDDQGMPTDTEARKIDFKQSEIYLIETKLRALLAAESAAGGGINLVVFTHGWHGNASADNDYSTEFKAILQKVTDVEALDTRRRQVAPNEPETRKLPFKAKERITVGIEIAWRGDSFESPAALNIWDRKHAAETVAKGSMHELLAFLHQFYLTYSCNDDVTARSTPGTRCDLVHMLTLGHSFGALINFGTLIARIERGLNTGCDARAYAFGDLTVLLNPAFEGSRYSPVFESAMHHPDVFGHYPGGSDNDVVCKAEESGIAAGTASATSSSASAEPDSSRNDAEEVQLPVLVTLQSHGDAATGTAFPIFKSITSMFTSTPFDDEARNEREAAGWVDAFRTHHLALQDESAKACYRKPSEPAWYCPTGWTARTTAPKPSNSEQAGGEFLEWVATNPAKFPDYLPIWSVMVDASIMRDHDDIWNPRIVAFIAELFRDAYDQADAIHYRRAHTVATSNGDQGPTRAFNLN